MHCKTYYTPGRSGQTHTLVQANSRNPEAVGIRKEKGHVSALGSRHMRINQHVLHALLYRHTKRLNAIPWPPGAHT